MFWLPVVMHVGRNSYVILGTVLISVHCYESTMYTLSSQVLNSFSEYFHIFVQISEHKWTRNAVTKY